MIRRPPRSTRTDTLLPYTTLFRSIAEAARERNADLLVSHLSPGSAEDLEYAMATSRATGVIFIGQSSLHHAFNALAKRDNRFVVWGAGFPDAEYCSVGSDNFLGGKRAAAHLARLGPKRILFLGDSEEIGSGAGGEKGW